MGVKQWMCVREAGVLCVHIAHMKCILKIRKPVFLPKTTHFCKNILILSGDQVHKLQYNIIPAPYWKSFQFLTLIYILLPDRLFGNLLFNLAFWTPVFILSLVRLFQCRCIICRRRKSAMHKETTKSNIYYICCTMYMDRIRNRKKL